MMAKVLLTITRATTYKIETPDFALPESRLNFAYNGYFDGRDEGKEVGQEITEIYAETEFNGEIHEQTFYNQ